MPKPRVSGIYSIRNMITKEEYIGSSVDIYHRIKDHFGRLKSRLHRSHRFQSIYDEYGSQSFSYNILEVVPNKDNLYLREQWWIDILKPELNVLKTTISNRYYGHAMSDEIKQRISISQKSTWTKERRTAWSIYKKSHPSYEKGIKFSSSACDRIAYGGRENKFPTILMDGNGNIYKVFNLNRFCRDHNINRRKIRWLCSGKSSIRYNYDGWKIIEAAHA